MIHHRLKYLERLFEIQRVFFNLGSNFKPKKNVKSKATLFTHSHIYQLTH